MSITGPAVIKKKFSKLLTEIRKTEKAVLAFSGGVDSSFLLKAMKIAGLRILAVTAVSETMPTKDLLSSISFTKELGVEHLIIKTEELHNEAFVSNPPERCFICKDGLFRRIKAIAEENKYRFIFDGSNSDDLNDYRPGRKAATLYGVRSPLAECGFTKDEIRSMSKELGLNIWNKPSSPCLSSRFPYGQRITSQALERVEKAEEFLRTLGIGDDVRVRNHGDTARIEVSEKEIHMLLSPAKRQLITKKLKSLGYKFVSLDLDGYKSGSMNRVLEKQGTGYKLQDAN